MQSAIIDNKNTKILRCKNQHSVGLFFTSIQLIFYNNFKCSPQTIYKCKYICYNLPVLNKRAKGDKKK